MSILHFIFDCNIFLKFSVSFFLKSKNLLNRGLSAHTRQAHARLTALLACALRMRLDFALKIFFVCYILQCWTYIRICNVK